MKQIKNDVLVRAIAIVFKRLREKTGLSQEKVMDDLKIDKGLSLHVGRLETAKINPTISTIDALCVYYNISLSNFFKLVEKEIQG
ncbi:helix-turn-helix domain-containing protein [Polluticaenibacter yanchengensis]|uniref:Helix-turn-helix transcriptional regulator n=1 Tax=Polluticaenibacter yanchengensis TaxID=3014562 RepID=A0ABT4UFR0_9BACT|nr:helix-turn-helix transcriptional regulator [Chitinophagaceae bacterium LY-5]